MNCIFCKIISGEIPSQRVYENDDMIIIKEIAPQARLHYLMIPKQHYPNILEMTDEQSLTLGKSIKTISRLIDELGLASGFRLISNCGEDACQSIEHLHFHIVGGQNLSTKIC